MRDLPSRADNVSNAAWLHEVMQQAAQASRAGDGDEVERIRAHVLTQGGPQLLNIVDEAFRGAALAQGLSLMQAPGVTIPLGAALPGYKLCDFCSSTEVVAYFPFERFTVADPAGMAVNFDSGDRWYVCARCRRDVEANDWKAIRDWVGPAGQANRQLWLGFRVNRTGPAVPYHPDDAPGP
jgi:hypothetical protein